MVAKINPTSPRGIIPSPMRSLSPGAPSAPTEASILPMMATTNSPPAIPSTSGLMKVSTRALIPISRKNTGMNKCPTGASSRWIRSDAVLPESARPATKAPTIGASCAASASSAKPSVNAKRDRDESSRRLRMAVEELEHPRGELRAHDGRDNEEADRHQQDERDVDDRHRPFGDEAYHHGEDHEPQDVVGHRGTQHGAGLHGREGAQVAEDTRGDAHAGGRERSADEQRLVAAVPERRCHGVATGHGDDHTDARDRHRRAADRAEVGDVHLHADAEKQQDHPELTEHAQRLVGPHQCQDRRTDDDTGHDLTDDRRDVDALGELRRDLGRDEHDQDVQQDRADVHQLSAGSARAISATATAAGHRERAATSWSGALVASLCSPTHLSHAGNVRRACFRLVTRK